MGKRRRAANGAAVASRVRSAPPLKAALAGVRAEIARLRGVIATYEGLIADLEHMQSRIMQTQTPTRAGSHADAAAAILAAHGKPMQLKDLIDAIEASGVHITGRTLRNRRTNLIIAMKRSQQFKRLGDGVYALADSRAA